MNLQSYVFLLLAASVLVAALWAIAAWGNWRERRDGGKRNVKRSRRVFTFQRLEDRRMMTAVPPIYIGHLDNQNIDNESWSVAANWQDHSIPGIGMGGKLAIFQSYGTGPLKEVRLNGADVTLDELRSTDGLRSDGLISNFSNDTIFLQGHQLTTGLISVVPNAQGDGETIANSPLKYSARWT